jgi:hypothetical protein
MVGASDVSLQGNYDTTLILRLEDRVGEAATENDGDQGALKSA